MAGVYIPIQYVQEEPAEVVPDAPGGRLLIKVNRGEPVELSRLNFKTYADAEGYRDSVVRTYKALGWRTVGNVNGDTIYLIWPNDDKHEVIMSVSEVSL